MVTTEFRGYMAYNLCMSDNRVTIKVDTGTRYLLRQISATTGKSIKGVIDDLARESLVNIKGKDIAELDIERSITITKSSRG